MIETRRTCLVLIMPFVDGGSRRPTRVRRPMSAPATLNGAAVRRFRAVVGRMSIRGWRGGEGEGEDPPPSFDGAIVPSPALQSLYLIFPKK